MSSKNYRELHMVKHLLSIAMVLSVFATTPALGKVIHNERSLYRNILVEDQGDVRCLKFNVKRSKSSQSCIYKSDPQRLVFNYTKLLFSGLLMIDEPKNVLIIGLGGGTMSNALHQLFPQAHIDNVEIDPAVIKVARKYFAFFENERIKSVVQDGRIFVKRAAIKNKKYDWVILDAFNGDYIPEHLLTQEYLQEVKSVLTDDGIITANTFSISKLYEHESATYHQVFGNYFNVSNSKNSNRVILASANQLPTSEAIMKRINALGDTLSVFGVDIKAIEASMTSTQDVKDWPADTRILTDQYSPANLLNN